MNGVSIDLRVAGLMIRPAEERRHEPRQILGAGRHRAGRARREALGLGLEVLVGVVAIGDVVGKLGPVDDAGASHAERRKQRLLHQLIERPAFLLLDDELHQVDTLAGVPVTRARREVQVHLLVRLEHGEVGKPRGVRQQHARRDRRPGRIAHELRARFRDTPRMRRALAGAASRPARPARTRRARPAASRRSRTRSW